MIRTLRSRASLLHGAGTLTSAFLALVWMGCASSDGAAIGRAAPSSDGEASRVQAYLGSLYAAGDVRHSFVSAMGDTIDCTDFARAPGVRALLDRGMTMDDVMAPIRQAEEARPKATGGAPRNAAYFQGEPDGDGHVRACPDGTFPQVRVTPERIAARGGLDAYLAAIATKVAPSRKENAVHPLSSVPADGGLQQDTSYYAWVMNDFSVTATLASVQGGTSTTTIAAPTIATAAATGDHSLSQVWLTGADHATGLPRQTIEAGWEALAGATPGPQPAYLFVGTTNHAYAPFCKNNNTSSGCPAWVPNPTASLAFSQALPASTPGGAQHELTITIQHQYTLLISCIIRRGCYLTKNYTGWGIWASVDGTTADTYLGYYDNAGYSDDGNSGLSVGGDNFEVGGEIFDGAEKFGPPPEVQMGEGPLVGGRATSGSTAYHHDFGYYDAAGTLQTGGSTVHNTNPEYGFDLATPPRSASWVNYFYFGDMQ